MKFHDPDFHGGCDAVVMLTVSDWKTEPRSNRYHYATRFARHRRVIFVQPDRKAGHAFEDSDSSGVELLHVPEQFGPEQSAAIATGLAERGILRPLLWIYSANYVDAVERLHAPLRVLHATEDYFQPELRRQQVAGFFERLSALFTRLDLLVAVSEGVLRSYVEQGGFRGETLLLENGCDFKDIRRVVEAAGPIPEGAPVAFYQGGINYRLDFPLLLELARLKPDWMFEFCGLVTDAPAEWREMQALPNVRNLGALLPEDVMGRAARATVGLMPFCRTPFIQQKSFPLKAFEYAACGLPVVGVPIDSLARWPRLFRPATTVQEFAEQIESARRDRLDPGALEQRLAVARQQDYDERFERLQETLTGLLARPTSPVLRRLNMLVLYASNSTHTPTVQEYLAALARFSDHHVTFADAVQQAPAPYDMGQFDVILVHYSVRLTLDDYISPAVVAGLKASGAFRILTIQDEYEATERARRWMDELGFHAILTCVPDGQAGQVYPRERYPATELIPILTGYVPEGLERARTWRPLRERPVTIGYRGRRLPYIYGELGQEKYQIALQMRALCERRGVRCDIEWDESKRIYGDAWYAFIGDCRAMLGSESGSNVFDFDGSIRRQGELALQDEPNMSFEEFHARYLRGIDGKIRMNQISPRVFEAIALGTPLILFEGSYSGVVRPGEHYLPLKKDFSNADEIFERLQDLDALEAMAGRAYRDVIGSRRYSYQAFVRAIDEFVVTRVGPGKPWLPLSVAVGMARTDANDVLRGAVGGVPRGHAVSWPLPYSRYLEPVPDMGPVWTDQRHPQLSSLGWRTLADALLRKVARRCGRALPQPMRGAAKRLLRPVVRALRLA